MTKTNYNLQQSERENRDGIEIFGEFIVSELRSIKNEISLHLLKKKIQDAIFEAKMDLLCPDRNGE